VIQRLRRLWPDLIIVRGRPRHPQTQGSVERANKDVEEMLGKWMIEHDNKQWSIGKLCNEFANYNYIMQIRVAICKIEFRYT
jgi:hypothetical protein